MDVSATESFCMPISMSVAIDRRVGLSRDGAVVVQFIDGQLTRHALRNGGC